MLELRVSFEELILLRSLCDIREGQIKGWRIDYPALGLAFEDDLKCIKKLRKHIKDAMENK